MNKRTLQLINAVIPKSNQKREFEYALIDFGKGIIVGTDTRSAVKVNLQEDEAENCHGQHLLHKKVLMAIISLMDNLKEYKFIDNHIQVGDTRIALDTVRKDIEPPYIYPKIDNVFKKQEKYINVDDIMYLDFDLTIANTYVLSSHLKPIQEFGTAHTYRVEMTEQRKDSVGVVRVVGLNSSEDKIYTRFEAMVMGIEYEKKQPTLF